MSHQHLEALDVAAIREEFPILQREFDGQQVVYLDNAATTQTPDPVVDAMSDYYRESNANVHRGIHHLSQEASNAYETAHDRVAEFINADGREEVVFTKNTTEGENLLAYAWGLNELGPEDEVVLTEMEHHASLVTWQQIAERTGATVRYIRIDEDGRLDMDHAADLIADDTAIVSAAHVSNTLGTVNPVGQLTDLAHDHDALSFIDGAQAVPNRPVDVKAIDADFYAFSGHKMAGPTGIGVLYGKRDLFEELDPFLYGGGMIRKVTFEDSTWGDLPWKFEPGTPQIAEAVGLHAAVDWLEDIGLERIQAHEEELAAYAYDRLAAEDDVELYGPDGSDRGGLVSFNLDGVHAHDLTSIMNDHTIAVRAGDHCTQPLHDKLGVPASTRASFYVYNTREEIDKLVDALDDARQLFA
ncbi:aminotransferase class V-fold PLP-dependent enzyme [Natrialba asiatica]|uniref:cysteine desulfurase n=1 Tax=Natrialba asiatica (strain ATCC 700177 / DSM 12278 / JCM 9576 / FERM P-10747 / NBRC 102637 / 172P1) TaxID=29540 RepID=M0AGJ6_NATA1|nr:cysteine desulfurase [Natrialba asiatica]ELY97855.1 cysteine desulfurase [Natrialba asiatica DSM 12278]